MATPTPAPLAPIALRVGAPAVLPPLTAGGLSWAPIALEDAADLNALRNAVAEADGEPVRESEAETADDLAGPGHDLATDSLIGRDTDGTARAWATVVSPPGDTGTVRAFLFGGVHPDRRGEGIGAELFAWQEARARQVLAAGGKDVPARIGVYASDTVPAAAVRLYERAGFTPRRYYADLERDLRDPAAPPLPDVVPDGSLRLVPLTNALDEPTRLAHNDAFRDHWGSEPRTAEQWRSGRTAYAPEWSFAVVDDAPDVLALLADPATDPDTAAALRAGEPLVVAYHVAARYTEDFAVRGHPFGYTELLGVRRAYRGRRLSLALLVAGMRAFAADGMAVAALDVDTQNPSGAHGLYARLGYVKRYGSTLRTIEL
ncbi:GNAT family N-acetyltransferase [Isoptericola sp. BMS4]|uniref:GNAT family N-acetyltransferase n=1 Tax=Isoptericola sp. BMS4 TaxID=2527875 RepID=UPI00141FA1A7|nr:GNAT family N-acetyltransferase [Isoptericola sp. BMS4]